MQVLLSGKEPWLAASPIPDKSIYRVREGERGGRAFSFRSSTSKEGHLFRLSSFRLKEPLLKNN